MKRLIVYLVAAATMGGLVIAGCTQAPPAPTPTKAPAAPTTAPAPTKAAEPAKAAAPVQPTVAPPTAAPAKKVDYPEKGKPITIMVPWPAGNANDMVARLTAEGVEKELGTPVQVVNKPGASTQVGMTELARTKPDGYTLAVTTTNTTALTYLDPERQAVFSRKDFTPVAVVVLEPMVLAVKGDSPYKTTKDLMDAAKAAPEKITVGDSGFMTPSHFLTIALGKAGGARFTSVHLGGSPEIALRVLAGDIVGYSGSPSDALTHYKSGAFRILGNTGTEEHRLYPGIKSLRDQGYNVVLLLSRAMAAPGGTPKEIVDILSGVVKKITADAGFRKKIEDTGLTVRFMDAAQYTAHWDEVDAQTKVMVEEAKAEQAKK